MKILYDPALPINLQNSDLFFDTNTLIATISYPTLFGEFFKNLKKNDCAFLTIPSVVFEFTRGVSTLDDFNKRTVFIESFVLPYEIQIHSAEFRELIIILQRIKGSASYTDFLLCACLYKFPKSFLITENHTDFPLDILDRKHIITIDTEKQIRNYGIYQFSPTKFEKAAINILQGV